jgi:zinc finger protein
VQNVVPGRCPYCEREIQYLYQTENIPFFSDILIVSARCDCGYRHADTMVLGMAEPARWEDVHRVLIEINFPPQEMP